ncbi:hypothetical protein V8C40DRAFT_228999 [Trichoderma camerunense]
MFFWWWLGIIGFFFSFLFGGWDLLVFAFLFFWERIGEVGGEFSFEKRGEGRGRDSERLTDGKRLVGRNKQKEGEKEEKEGWVGCGGVR